MSKTHMLLDRLARYAAWAGGAAVLFIAFFVTADIITRKFFAIKLQNVPEIVGYIFIVAVTWSFSCTLLQRGHIRIDVLYGHLPRRLAAAADVLSVATLLLVASLLAYYAVEIFRESWSAGSRSVSSLNAPLWLPQLFWAAGMVFLVVVTAYILVRALISLFRKDWAAVNRVAGVPTIGESIEEEMQTPKNPTHA